MARNPISASSIEPNKYVTVRGIVDYSHVASQYTGAALQRRIDQQRSLGAQFVVDRPHTTITIVDAVLVPGDANALTLEEQYVAHSIYDSKSGRNAGKKVYRIEDTGAYLPVVFAQNEGGQDYSAVPQPLQGELANGLEVTLVLRTFASKQYSNRGISLAQIMVHGPIEYYSSAGGAATDALAARGFVITGDLPRAIAASEGIVRESDEGEAPAALPNTAVDAQGYASPALPQQAPAVPAAVQAQAQQPAPQAAPAPADAGASPFDAQPAAAAAPAMSDEERARKKAEAEAILASLG